MTPENIAIATLQERLAIACSPDTADEILMLLAQDRGLDVRRALTERKGLSDQLMQQLVNDKSKDIRLRMAKHTELTARYMEILAGSRETIIRTAIASREGAPENILLKLAASNNKDVGLALLKRTKLSDELLGQLITHRSKDVRSTLALRKILSEALITTLVEDNDNEVVTAVAGRAQLSDEYIEKLFTHKNNKVRAAIAARHDLPMTMIEEFAMEKNIEVFYAVVSRDDLPEHLLDKMLSEKNSTLRTRLAQRVPLRHDVVKALAQDESDKVRAAVAARSDITKSMIEKFTRDSSMNVRMTVAIRNDASEQMQRRLLDGLAHETDDINDLLLYIKKMSNAHLTVVDHKLKFGEDDVFGGNWNLDGCIDYKILGRLLQLLFNHPSSRVIQEIEINIDWSDNSFDKSLVALSGVQTPTEVKRITLERDNVDLSMASCSNLNTINKQWFPNLEKLSISYSEVSFNLDLPNLKEISITSSGDDFHEILLMLKESTMPKLEKIEISAGYWLGYTIDPPNHEMKISLHGAHEIWPNLKSFIIGTRHAYDWRHLLNSQIFKQLNKLEIDLDDFDVYEEDELCSDENTGDCYTVMCKNATALLDALIDLSDALSNIGSITIGIGEEIISGSNECRIDKEKIARLNQLYNFIFNIKHFPFVGGYE